MSNMYVTGIAAPYIPATFRGSWDKTSGASTRCLDLYKIGSWIDVGGNISNSDTNATNPYRVCIGRFISRKLAAQTIDGTLDMVLGLIETNAAANFYTKIYAFVTQGDSDSVRGVLLDYVESAAGGATEWPTTQQGVALKAAQTLSSVVCSAGDRIVIEFGFSAENAVTTSYTGRVRTGTWSFTALAALPDLTVGSTSTSTQAGYFNFSDTITYDASEPTNVNPELATDITTTPHNGTYNPVNRVIPLWFKRTAVSGDNGALAAFAGVSAAGVYAPEITIFSYISSVWDLYGGGLYLEVNAKVATMLVTTGATYYWNVTDDTVGAATATNLEFRVRSGPALPSTSDMVDDFLISSDGDDVYPAAVVDKDDGTIRYVTQLVASENGAVNDNGIICLDDKESSTRVALYNPNFTLITYVTGIKGVLSPAPVATDGTYFYIAGYFPADLVYKIFKVDSTGTILYTKVTTIDASPRQIQSIAVNSDASILYYSKYDLSGGGTFVDEPLKRWDLTNNVALSDLVAEEAGVSFQDLLCQLSSGDIITHANNSAGTSMSVRRYNSSGVLQTTYTVSTTLPATAGVDHLALDRGQTHFWVWFQTDASGRNQFRKYLISSGALISTISDTYSWAEGKSEDSTAAGSAPTYYFGPEDSCPFLVLDAPAAPTNTLTVIKVTNPTGSPQSFGFTASGGAISPTSFNLQDGQSQVYSGLADGVYSIVETVPSGWSVGYVVSNGDPNTAIDLAGGESVTVTVTDTQAAGYGSGIYEMIKDKTDDTIWVTAGGSTVDVAIP